MVSGGRSAAIGRKNTYANASRHGAEMQSVLMSAFPHAEATRSQSDILATLEAVGGSA